MGLKCAAMQAPSVASPRSLFCQLLLVVVLCSLLFVFAAVAVGDVLPNTVAVSRTESGFVASFLTSTVLHIANVSLPRYADLLDTPLNGVYCVDEVNGVIYVGSNVLHVLKIRSQEVQVGVTGSPSETAYYVEQVDSIQLNGWATACVFANRYELFISAAGSPSTGTGVTLSSDADGGETTPTTLQEGHFVIVVHRYLHRALRFFSTAAPLLPGMGNGPATRHLLAGASVVMRPDSVSSYITRVVTPFANGYVCVEDIQSPTTTSQYITVDDGFIPQSVVQPAEGQRSGKTRLYILELRSSASSTGSGYSSTPSSPPSSSAASEKLPDWEIVGVALPSLSRVAHAASTVSQAEITERFARCYDSSVRDVCPDCSPVALTASKAGLLVAWTSAQLNRTFLSLLATGTVCTITETESSTVPPPSPWSSFSSTSRDQTSSAAGDSLNDSIADVGVPPWWRREEIIIASNDEVPQQHFVFAAIMTEVCKVAATVVDDYAASYAYAALQCPFSGSQAIYPTPPSRRTLVRVDLSAMMVAPEVAVAALPVVQPGTKSLVDADDGTEEVMALVLCNSTRLLYLSVRRADGAVRVYTYAAFGALATLPAVVDARGGSVVDVRGYGLLPGMKCVFSGSRDAVVEATFLTSALVRCRVPALLTDVCDAHRVALLMVETEQSAIPTSTPHNAALSPEKAMLLYVPTPFVSSAVNIATGVSVAAAGSNVTVLVTGFNFINTSDYELNAKCIFKSISMDTTETAAAAAVFVNSTALLCTFVSLPLYPSPTYLFVTTDGMTLSRTSTPFNSLGPAVGLEANGRVSYNVSENVSVVSYSSAFILPLRSAPYTPLEPLYSTFVDASGSEVVGPAISDDLQATLVFHNYAETREGLDNPVMKNRVYGTLNIPPPTVAMFGTTTQPFDASGVARFDDVALACPPLGFLTFCVHVSVNGTISTDFNAGCIVLEIVEGEPHAPVFVGMPSTSYFPDEPQLQNAAVVGVEDECGNVYRYLNDSVMKGPLTVRVFSGDASVDGATWPPEFDFMVFTRSWTVDTPLNNLFFIDNISIPAPALSSLFFVEVSADLPQPSVVSPPISIKPCSDGRQSMALVLLGNSSDENSWFTGVYCEQCFPHGVCNGSAITQVADGYWRPSITASAFTSCRAAYGMAEACARNSQCTAGYHGVLCGECDTNYHTQGRACRKCLSRSLQSFVAFLVILGMVVLMVTCVVFMTLIPPSSLLVLSLRSLLLASQIASLFIYVGVPWPQQLETLFNGMYAYAEMIETVLSCFLRPGHYLIVLAAMPIVVTPLVAIISGCILRLAKLHRLDSHRMSAIVLMALLHRKQERFHQLRHIIAQEMGQLGTASVLSRRNNASDERQMRNSYSVSASATRLSLSEEWNALERGSAATVGPARMSGGWGGRAARPLSHSVHSAMSAGAASVSVATRGSAFSPSSMASSEQTFTDDMEGFVIELFATHTSAVLERLAAASEPTATWEQLVVKAMREGNPELMEAMRDMPLPLLTQTNLQRWVEHTTAIAVEVSANGNSGSGKPSADPNRAEASFNSSSKSTVTARGTSPSGQPASSPSPEDVGAASAYADVSEAKSAASDATSARVQTATTVTWKRVGMIAAYRGMAVHQYRASWSALCISTASLVLTCFYLPAILKGILWLRCLEVRLYESWDKSAMTIPMTGANMNCDSAEYRSYRNLGIAMVIFYGFGLPVAQMIFIGFLRNRYGTDVCYAAFPVIFFGDSTLDYVISVSYLLTKVVAVVAVTQSDSPMLQVGVLSFVFAVTIFLNSMWSSTGQYVMMRVGDLTVTLRSVMTMSRVLQLLVCHILVLLAYLIVSGHQLTTTDERGFVAIVSIGIALVFALFSAVTVHQFVGHIRHARNYRAILARREQEQQQILAALVRRYFDICNTIELYLKVCDRGLAAAQKLDTLSAFTRIPDDDAATITDENVLSFSSFNDNEASPHNNRDDEDADLSTDEMTRSSTTEHESTAAASFMTASGSHDHGPQALTHFTPYPRLSASNRAAHSIAEKEAARRRHHQQHLRRPQQPARRRNTAAFMSTAMRAPGGALAASTSASTAQQQSQQTRFAADVLGSLLQPLRGNCYPGTADLVPPVDGNDNWVGAPRSGEEITVSAAAAAGTAAVAPPVATTAAATPATPSPADGEGGSPTHAGALGGEKTEDGKAVVENGEGAGDRIGDSGQKQTGANAADTGRPAENGGKVGNDGDGTAADGRSLRKATSDFFSGDFTDVQMPARQPTLKRSDSLLLSIRCLSAEMSEKVRQTRHHLVEESEAVAMAAYLEERRQITAGYGKNVYGGAEKSGGSPVRQATTGMPHELPTPPAVDGVRQASGPAGKPSLGARSGGITIESCAPVVELDLASSFDLLAVPPLPLTRAISQLRPAPSSTAVTTGSRGATQTLLAGLQNDLEADLRQFNAIPLRDSLLDIDLEQLITTTLCAPQPASHTGYAWGNTTAGGAAGTATSGALDGMEPLSMAGRSHTNNSADKGGGTGAAAPVVSKSLPLEKADTVSGTPLGSGNDPRMAGEAPATNTAATGSSSSSQHRRDESPAQADGVGGGSHSKSADRPSSADAAAASTAPPPLPTFVFPERMAQHAHRTAAEYLRRRTARNQRVQRSRSGGSNAARTRGRSGNATPTTSRPAQERKKAGNTKAAKVDVTDEKQSKGTKD